MQVTTFLDRKIREIASKGAKTDLSRRQYFSAIAMIIAVSTILRFWNLDGASISMDEGATRAWAKLPLDFILFNNIDVHPPLTYAVQHVWHSLFPALEWMRVPAALAGIASIGLTMFVVRDRSTRRAAVITGALLAVSTAHVYYSQDARMYPFLMCGLMIAFYGASDISGSRWRMLAYIFGALIAIYSHAIGLIAMAIIGGSGLISGYLRQKRDIIVPWFAANFIVLVFALPWLISIFSASESFSGLGDDVSIFHLQWVYRNAMGAPGLFYFSPPIELTLLVLAFIGSYLALIERKFAFAFAVAGLCFLYPIIIGLYHLNVPILATRVMIPSLLGIVVAVGYCLSKLETRWQLGLTTVLVASFSISTVVELNNRFKFDQNHEATQYALEQGMGDAPHIACNRYSMAAIWEARPEIRLYNLAFEHIGASPTQPLVHYKDPSFWRVLSDGALHHQRMTPPEISEVLGDDWIVAGGLMELLATENQAVLIESYCKTDHVAAAMTAMERSGFHLVSEINYRTHTEKMPVFIHPVTIVRLYQRTE